MSQEFKFFLIPFQANIFSPLLNTLHLSTRWRTFLISSPMKYSSEIKLQMFYIIRDGIRKTNRLEVRKYGDKTWFCH